MVQNYVVQHIKSVYNIAVPDCGIIAIMLGIKPLYNPRTPP